MVEILFVCVEVLLDDADDSVVDVEELDVKLGGRHIVDLMLAPFRLALSSVSIDRV